MLAARARRLIRAARTFRRFFIGLSFFEWVAKLGFGAAGLLPVPLAVCFCGRLEFGLSVGLYQSVGSSVGFVCLAGVGGQGVGVPGCCFW